MMVSDGNGVPIGLYLDSAQHHEIRLAESTLKTVRVPQGYRRRWIIERCFGWMNNYRRLVVRYDRYLHIYRAFCLIAFIIWCVNRRISANNRSAIRSW